jgi:hypothetical protein
VPDHQWRKSSFSPDGSNCVYIAANPTGSTIHLRESDEPQTVVTTTPVPLDALIRALKSQQPTH